MAKVRARPETNKLFLDFRYKGQRYREQTLLDDIPRNWKQLETLMQRIEAKIILGEYIYREFFPNSPNVAKAEALEERYQQAPAVGIKKRPTTPTFAEICQHWFAE